METIEIQREALNGAEPLCYGYKAVKWDSGTMQDFRYGETGDALVGKIFRVDGDIRNCNWGLHFSKDPANVFNFYEPLGYNRYFKVAAYEKTVDKSDGFKTVAQCIEFVEEYDLMQFIDLIKRLASLYALWLSAIFSRLASLYALRLSAIFSRLAS